MVFMLLSDHSNMLLLLLALCSNIVPPLSRNVVNSVKLHNYCIETKLYHYIIITAIFSNWISYSQRVRAVLWLRKPPALE